VQVNGQWHCRSEQANDESRELFVARLIVTSSSQARRCNGVFTLRYASHAFEGNSPSRGVHPVEVVSATARSSDAAFDNAKHDELEQRPDDLLAQLKQIP
jgi:hypothetical protein